MVELANPPTMFYSAFPRQLPGDAARVLQIQAELESFERLDPEAQEKILSGQLERLLAHAKRYSPYWRERLASWAPDGRPSGETLSSLPSLSRNDVKERFEEIVASFPRKRKMRTSKLSTSGSTGTPVTVEHLVDVHSPLQSAIMLLTARWHKIDPQKPLGTLLSKVKSNDKAPLGLPFRWYSPVAVGFSCDLKDMDDDDLYEYCAAKNPSYLLSGPTTLVKLARYAIRNERHELRPELGLSLGSAVTDEIREIVRDGLGTKIVDRYSSEEAGTIAVQCPIHDHLHVLSPLVMLEIVDEAGAPCSPGQPGRVLITNMHSYGMPLIRYDIGDMAEWGERCDCGIALPVIKTLWGRTRHMITHPDGTTTYAKIYAREFDDLENLEEYRFTLHRNNVVVAQLKVKEQSQELTRSVTETIQRAMSYPYPVKIQFVDEIDWGVSWKKEAFAVSDAPAPEDP